VIKHGSPELIKAVENGEVNIHSAAQVTDFPKDEQLERAKQPQPRKEPTPQPQATATPEAPKKTRFRYALPNIGNQYARIAIRNLDEIEDKDLEAVEALNKVKGYCDARLAKITKK
jgi:hypothetical protein